MIQSYSRFVETICTLPKPKKVCTSLKFFSICGIEFTEFTPHCLVAIKRKSTII